MGDSPYHAGYACQLYNGKLPDWDEGIQCDEFKERVESPNSEYPDNYKHIASPYPPLFYAIQAIFIGPMMEAGEWESAILVGRIINVFLGVFFKIQFVLCCLALWGKYRKGLFILTPLFSLLLSSIIDLSSRLLNDTLVADYDNYCSLSYL